MPHASAHSRRTEPMKWNRNMDEAPRDGTKILLFTKRPIKLVVLSSWVGAPHNYWRDYLGWNHVWTHWAPIEPPGEDE